MSEKHRVGIGHDRHRLQAGGPLRLGGIEIAFDQGLAGHSDADVLLHAVTDAILGAAALGDIGELFPDTAEENRGRDSAEMLALAASRVRQRGYEIVNLDCIVFAERPKLSVSKPAIAARIGEILGIDPDRVGIKAKTGEGVGDVGTGKVIESQCVALLQQRS
jgi:2-C-methyl-D-erythritol 2,4-cyclodiphosphate synthase